MKKWLAVLLAMLMLFGAIGAVAEMAAEQPAAEAAKQPAEEAAEQPAEEAAEEPAEQPAEEAAEEPAEEPAEQPAEEAAEEPTEQPAEETGEGTEAENAEAPEEPVSAIVAATWDLTGNFSPFFAEAAGDQDVVGLTQIGMLTIDRAGCIVHNGIEGEKRAYNGTDYTYSGAGDLSVDYDEAAGITTYTYRLREGMRFSDGEPVTIDDVIFNYYVYLDPAYDGPNTLGSYDIVGLRAYHTQIPEANLEAVTGIVDAIKAAFAEGGAAYTVTEGDPFTQEEYDSYASAAAALWKADLQGIVDYVYENFAADYAESVMGLSAEEIGASDGLRVAFGAAMWGLAVEGEEPSIDDLYASVFAQFGGNLEAYLSLKSPTQATAQSVDNALMTKVAEDQGVDLSASVPNIEGIRRVDDSTVAVRVHGFEAPAVYNIMGLFIAPLHHYGDPEQYDYENNRFGHPFGDLSLIRSRTAQPLGAGPYRFVSYEYREVCFEANESYYRGAPQIGRFCYREIDSAELVAAVKSGTVDGGVMVASKHDIEALRSANSNGELTGNVETAWAVPYPGYGYIGMNADTMNVAGQPDSDASRALRRGFATMLSVYRDAAIENYYGDAAAVIDYPISASSWASPAAGDPDYRAAFSVDVDGNDIYTDEMTQKEKYEAALQAAIGFFKAAGYTFDETAGKFTGAPEGASLSYEAIILGYGTGTHPSYAVLTDARTALKKIGIELKINDPADSNVLWDALDAGTQNMWCAAWGAAVDPDMYQVYHSDNIVGQGGSDSNLCHLRSPELDRLIMDARRSDDQAHRRQVYRAALDEIVNWAVEVPVYQRRNIIVASTARVDCATITPDITPYWGWLSEVETMKLVENAK